MGGTATGDAAAGGRAPRQPEQARRRSSSPAWPRPGCWSARRHSTVNPGEVTGYAVGLPHHTATDGQIIWYGGGKLAADLTLPKLRARWDNPPDA